jgi:hypothetical protein
MWGESSPSFISAYLGFSNRFIPQNGIRAWAWASPSRDESSSAMEATSGLNPNLEKARRSISRCPHQLFNGVPGQSSSAIERQRSGSSRCAASGFVLLVPGN